MREKKNILNKSFKTGIFSVTERPFGAQLGKAIVSLIFLT